jgi:Tfp pilus assembly protein FimT
MRTQGKNGYSLVEILVYLAIFTALSILVINSFMSVLSTFSVTNMNRKILESGSTSMDRITREIRQAKLADVGTAGTLVLTGDTTTKIAKENGSLNFYKNNVLQGNLLGQKLSVTNLSFSQITTAKSMAVKIIMTLQYSDGKNIKSENFYDTIILRGGYK